MSILQIFSSRNSQHLLQAPAVFAVASLPAIFNKQFLRQSIKHQSVKTEKTYIGCPRD